MTQGNPDYWITGGSGFIGTRLIKTLLEQGLMVRNIDKNTSTSFPEITVIQDIRDPSGLKNRMTSGDVVVHLAAEHRDDVTPTSLYYDVNVTGTRNVLEAMEAAGINSIIFTSTVAVYGLNKIDPAETSPTDPFNHYGRSKLQAEELIREWQARDPARCAIILRPCVIFGEGNRGNVYNLLRQISSGKFVMIGNGKNTKSMAYVGNIAAFIHFLSGHLEAGSRIFNYTDLPDLSTNELIVMVRNEFKLKNKPLRLPYFAGMAAGYLLDFASFLLRKKLNISAVRIRKFCATTRFNSQKAHDSGFVAPYPMEEALHTTIRHEFTLSPSLGKLNADI